MIKTTCPLNILLKYMSLLDFGSSLPLQHFILTVLLDMISTQTLSVNSGNFGLYQIGLSLFYN